MQIRDNEKSVFREAIMNDRAFYVDWLLPKLRELIEQKGWEQPVVKCLGELGYPGFVEEDDEQGDIRTTIVEASNLETVTEVHMQINILYCILIDKTYTLNNYIAFHWFTHLKLVCMLFTYQSVVLPEARILEEEKLPTRMVGKVYKQGTAVLYKVWSYRHLEVDVINQTLSWYTCTSSGASDVKRGQISLLRCKVTVLPQRVVPISHVGVVFAVSYLEQESDEKRKHMFLLTPTEHEAKKWVSCINRARVHHLVLKIPVDEKASVIKSKGHAEGRGLAT